MLLARLGWIGRPCATGRYNGYGLDGLADRWGDGRAPQLSPEEKGEPVSIVLAGPDPEASGISAFTREDLVRICQQRFGRGLHVTSMGRILRELGVVATKGETELPGKGPGSAGRV
jgi:transposase